jgi:hypothetical protein
VDEVLEVLGEAAAWLHGRGLEQWPARFDPSWVEGAVRRGETWLALAGGTVSGTVTPDQCDSVWDGLPGAATPPPAAPGGAVDLDLCKPKDQRRCRGRGRGSPAGGPLGVAAEVAQKLGGAAVFWPCRQGRRVGAVLPQRLHDGAGRGKQLRGELIGQRPGLAECHGDVPGVHGGV